MIRREKDHCSINPLPFRAPAPALKPSLARGLLESSFLFPLIPVPQAKTSDADPSSPSASTENPEPHKKNTASDNSMRTGLDRTDPIGGSRAVGVKKSVRFIDDVTMQLAPPMPMTCAAPGPGGTYTRWYAQSDFDRFKFEASKQAGVKIARGSPSGKKGKNPRRFFMTGDFDHNADNGNSDRPHYNENEYGDETSVDGTLLCKRGLGYHFSRSRKKARSAAVSAVLAWQRTLRDPKNVRPRGPGPRGGADTNRAERTRTALALISARCSRVSGEEARWRGDVDYRVAHPERQGACVPGDEGSVSSEAGVADATSDVATKRKDNRSDGIILGGEVTVSRKRRRITADRRDCGGGSSDGEGPSPASLEYLGSLRETTGSHFQRVNSAKCAAC